MSGGHFDYIQYHLQDTIESIKDTIAIQKNEQKPDWIDQEDWEKMGAVHYRKGTLKEFEKALKLVSKAQVYIHRIDWLLSGDDSESAFHERLKEDLEDLKK